MCFFDSRAQSNQCELYSINPNSSAERIGTCTKGANKISFTFFPRFIMNTIILNMVHNHALNMHTVTGQSAEFDVKCCNNFLPIRTE